MSTWAIIREVWACDVVIGATVDAALAGKFTPTWIAANSASYIQVPNGTQSSAKDNGDGTFTNPVAPAPVQYRQITRAVLDDILEAVFTADRYGAILAAISTLTTNPWLAARRKLDNPGWAPSRQQIIDLLTALRGADIPTAGTKITATEITAVASRQEWIAPN